MSSLIRANITVPSALLERARRSGLNVSGTCRLAIEAAVEACEQGEERSVVFAPRTVTSLVSEIRRGPA